jgi:hypothetical protein
MRRRPPGIMDTQDEEKTRAIQVPQALARLALSAAIDQSACENQARNFPQPGRRREARVRTKRDFNASTQRRGSPARCKPLHEELRTIVCASSRVSDGSKATRHELLIRAFC